MVAIDPATGIATLINVFTVQPAQANALVQLLSQATEQVMSTLPGYISASLHISLDKTHVTNYAQWQSIDHFKRMLENPKAKEHLEKAAALAIKFEPDMYTVAWQHVKPQGH